MKTIVQKYGGSSVATPEKIKAVAQFIRKNLSESDNAQICVVVSAMGHTTNDLLRLAHEVSANPIKRELDMLISCGERSSMALLAMALNDIGVSAMSLTGSQSGIITDDNHNGATIIAIKPERVIDAFSTHRVVIVAGFQGVSDKKEITTLRRGGSDTTAVALAYGLRADVCEIYTDVPGVMDVDPKIVELAQVIPEITFNEMEGMALYGAKVMAHDAMLLAKQFGVAVRVKKAFANTPGTLIHDLNRVLDDKRVISLTHLRGMIRLNLSNTESIENHAGYFLCGAQREHGMVAYVSNDISQELVEQNVEAGLALITLHLCHNQFGFSVLSTINTILRENKIAASDIIVGRSEIFLVVNDAQLQQSLELLHAKLLRSLP